MSPKVEWRRNDSPAGMPSAGWDAYTDQDRYIGQVFADGTAFILDGASYWRYIEPFSQPLAAQALLRAAGAATNTDETRRYKFGNEPRASVGDRVKVPIDGWVWQATVLSVDADGYTVRPDKRLFQLKRRRGQL